MAPASLPYAPTLLHSPSPWAPWVTLACAQDFTPLGTEGVFWGSKGNNKWSRGEQSKESKGHFSSSNPSSSPGTSGAVGGRFGWLEAGVCEAGSGCDSGG